MGSSPPNLKQKIQEYTNVLQEIQKRLDILYNRQDETGTRNTQVAEVYYAEAPEGKLVVGHLYGEKLSTSDIPLDLYSLASPNAQWLMQLADVERFAVDDCIVLTNSRNFEGWSHDEINIAKERKDYEQTTKAFTKTAVAL